jgi:type IV secretion system protein VirB1
MQAIIKTESAGHPYDLADAGPANLPWSQRKNMVRSLHPTSGQEAARMVADLVAKGHIVAIGLTQINVQNLPSLGLTVDQVLDPCTNIAAGAKILTSFYSSALKKLGTTDKQAALQAAISAYWSGDFERGFSGGYVQQVINNAGLAVELKIPNLAKGTILRSPHGTYRIDHTGGLSPYSAPLQASYGPRSAPPAGVKVVAIDPRRSPLEAPGFDLARAGQE